MRVKTLHRGRNHLFIAIILWVGWSFTLNASDNVLDPEGKEYLSDGQVQLLKEMVRIIRTDPQISEAKKYPIYESIFKYVDIIDANPQDLLLPLSQMPSDLNNDRVWSTQEMFRLYLGFQPSSDIKESKTYIHDKH